MLEDIENHLTEYSDKLSTADLDGLIEKLTQESYQLSRDFELLELTKQDLEEEITRDEEAVEAQTNELDNKLAELEKQILIESNKSFDLDQSSLHELSSSVVIPSDVSLLLNETIEGESVEVNEVTTELKENKLKLTETNKLIQITEAQLKQILNQNEIEENEMKNLRNDLQEKKEYIQDQEEELIVMKAEMNFLPKFKSQQIKNEEKSIYNEVVKDMEVIKTELSNKKNRLSEYAQMFTKIEMECNQIENDMQLLDVYDKEDEAKILQSHGNLLEAYKVYMKELEKNIYHLQICVSETSQVIHSNDNNVFKISKYHELVETKSKTLSRELSNYNMELANVVDTKSELEKSESSMRHQILAILQEMKNLEKQIQDIKINKLNEVEEKIKSEEISKGGKIKCVRFQTERDSPEKELVEKENGESKAKLEKKPLDKLPQQTHRVFIHKKKKNPKQFNVIKQDS